MGGGRAKEKSQVAVFRNKLLKMFEVRVPLYSQVLLLPLGVPPMLASDAPHESFSRTAKFGGSSSPQPMQKTPENFAVPWHAAACFKPLVGVT